MNDLSNPLAQFFLQDIYFSVTVTNDHCLVLFPPDYFLWKAKTLCVQTCDFSLLGNDLLIL